MFFRFSQDRVENDFEVIFDLPKAQKKQPKIIQKWSQKLEKINRGGTVAENQKLVLLDDSVWQIIEHWREKQ